MNEQGMEMISLFSEIDGRYITEAQNERITVRCKRIFKTPVLAAAIVVILALSSVGAVAFVKGFLGHKENVEHQYFYNEALIPELEKRAIEPLVFENEHLRITIDAIISDAIYVEASATIEGLDTQGKEFVALCSSYRIECIRLISLFFVPGVPQVQKQVRQFQFHILRHMLFILVSKILFMTILFLRIRARPTALRCLLRTQPLGLTPSGGSAA